jgi:hypothetical protein
MSYILLLVIVLLTSLILLYLITYRVLSGRIEQSEARVIAVFLQKIAKIPAVIEVMRPHVVDEHLAFDLMTRLHSE